MPEKRLERTRRAYEHHDQGLTTTRRAYEHHDQGLTTSFFETRGIREIFEYGQPESAVEDVLRAIRNAPHRETYRTHEGA